MMLKVDIDICFENMNNPDTSQWARIVCICLCLIAIPVCAQVQYTPGFTFLTNNGAITITRCGASSSSPGGEVDVPESTNGYPVTEISSNAFWQNNATSVGIPDSVTNIGEGAFADCFFLTNFVLAVGNTNYICADGALFNASMTVLIQYPAGLETPSYAIPDGVTRIGTYGFNSCVNLASVSVPNSITSIGDGAFYFCPALTNIEIPDGVANIGDFTFYFSGLTSVTIPNSVTNIGWCAFSGSSSLTNVYLGNGVRNIGVGAFNSCSLTSIVVPSSVTNLGRGWWSSTLTNIYFLGSPPITDPTFSADEQATAYYLPGATGWDSTLAGVPTALWLPQIHLANNSSVSNNSFSLNVNWASGQTVVVEACTNFYNPNWVPLLTNVLSTGLANFSDPQLTNYPNRFYRIRSD